MAERSEITPMPSFAIPLGILEDSISLKASPTGTNGLCKLTSLTGAGAVVEYADVVEVDGLIDNCCSKHSTPWSLTRSADTKVVSDGVL